MTDVWKVLVDFRLGEEGEGTGVEDNVGGSRVRALERYFL